jgi:outer membrane protein TolC
VVDESQRLLQNGLALGEVRLFDWISSQRRALEARREYAASLTRYREAVIRVETATGIPLSTAKSP